MKGKKASESVNLAQASMLVSERKKIESKQKKFDLERSAFDEFRSNEKARLEEIGQRLQTELHQSLLKQEEYEAQLIAIRDFIHEQKKFNERLDASVERLRSASNTLKDFPYDQAARNLLMNTSKSIMALTKLSAMRMEMLEFNIAPDVFSNMQPKKIAVWREFEKVHKSINNGAETTRDKFLMTGESVGVYAAQRILTIAIFIILENAWKYSPKDDQVKIKFEEDAEKIDVTVWNMGPSVDKDEINRLTERSYRGKNASITPGVDGKGLGLSIAKDILELCGVGFKIEVPDSDFKMINRVEYSPFVVRLRFPLKEPPFPLMA